MTGLFLEQVQVSAGPNLVADTTSTTTVPSTSAPVDMAGYDGVTFLFRLGDVDTAAVLTFAAFETNTSTDGSAGTALALTANGGNTTQGVITSGNLVVTESSGNIDNKVIAISIRKSSLTKRYVYVTLAAATESYELNACLVLRWPARSIPVTQSDAYAYAWAAA